MRVGRSLAALVLLISTLLPAADAGAHEFWLDPLPALPEAGAPIRTDLRVGLGLVGDAYPYLSRSFERFRLKVRGDVYDIAGNQGDLPAVSIAAAPAGLNVITYFGRPSLVTFEDAALFETYLREEGLDWVKAAHATRGLPPTGFREAFSRNVKLLVQSGPVTQDDRDIAVGMPFELVAGNNPYADPQRTALPVVLFWQQTPFADSQIAVFQDRGGSVTRTTIRTDAEGRATIPLSGGGRFLLSAVHMREAPPELNAAWESHWASMTFALPED